MGSLDTYPFDFVMQLYRSRLYAERKNHKMALRILKVKYDDLFSAAFETFISNLGETIHYLCYAHNKNFADMLRSSNDLLLPEN
jgi:hypothetical protein